MGYRNDPNVYKPPKSELLDKSIRLNVKPTNINWMWGILSFLILLLNLLSVLPIAVKNNPSISILTVTNLAGEDLTEVDLSSHYRTKNYLNLKHI